MNWVLFGVAAYVLLQLGVGLAVSRRIRTESDYLIAGRRIGLGLATFSMFATWFGAETCVGAAGKFYSEGLAGGTTDPFGYTIALVLMGVIFAVPLWKRGLTTLADLFRQRYSPSVERFAALIMAPTSVFWAAAQIRAFGQVMQASSDLEINLCITVAAGVVVLYTVTGGLLADVMTDLVQGIAILIGLGLLVLALAGNPGVDLSGAWSRLGPEKFNFFGGGSAWARWDLWVMTICGSLVAQEVAARILAARSPGVARAATIWGGGLYLVAGLVPAFLGLVGAVILPGLDNPEQILPRLAQQHLHTVLYIAFAGALVSAILSTVDSALLAAASLVSHNVIVSLRPAMPDREKLRWARVGVVVFGLIAYGLALGAKTIFELVQQANGVGSSGIFVLLVFGLFTRIGGRGAAVATLIVGLLTWAWGTYVAGWEYTYLVSLAASVTTYLLSSAVTRVTAGSTHRVAS